MSQPTEISMLFIVIGSLLLLGLATDFLGRQTTLPRVTLLFVFGFLLGPAGFNFLPEISGDWFPLVANTALLLVGFLLGGKLTGAAIRENGKVVLGVSLSVVVVTVLIVGLGLTLIGAPLVIALLLAGIATATDPAATLDVISETKAKGTFTDTLQGVVSIDDAWGLLFFSGLLAAVHYLNESGGSMEVVLSALWELAGAVGLGAVLGFPMAYISGRIKPGQPTLLEALGMVLLCGGLASWLDVSYLLSVMVLGFVVANYAKHHEQAFHEIEDIESPFMILFFVLTGASLNLDSLSNAGFIAIAYIGLRIIARLIGAWPGAKLSGASPTVSKWMGFSLLPQAGVATGMALIASAQFPELGETLLSIVVVATIFFEIVGPICTRISLKKAGDTAPG